MGSSGRGGPPEGGDRAPRPPDGLRAASPQSGLIGGARRSGGLYGGLPSRQGPPGFDARVLELGDELRREGLAIGTSELLDAFDALSEVGWTEPAGFREALATTLAKSQEDRRVFDALFDRFFFRAVEREAVEKGLTERRLSADGEDDGREIDFDSLREAVRAAIRGGSDGEMRDLARLSIAALGRQGEGSGVVGVDVQRIRRSLGLRGDPTGEAEA
nr:CoxE [Actinomycetota bacterium]